MNLHSSNYLNFDNNAKNIDAGERTAFLVYSVILNTWQLVFSSNFLVTSQMFYSQSHVTRLAGDLPDFTSETHTSYSRICFIQKCNNSLGQLLPQKRLRPCVHPSHSIQAWLCRKHAVHEDFLIDHFLSILKRDISSPPSFPKFIFFILLYLH